MIKLEEQCHDDGYYHVEDDFKLYPDAWCYVVWSKRGPGKTYSLLDYCRRNKILFIYMKRTKDDVDLICTSDNEKFDPSPYAPINRDKGCNIKAKSIKKGIGAFYNFEEGENGQEASGAPVSYIFANNAIKAIKGLELSDCDIICFDEFIPQIGEIVRSGTIEGEMLLSFYMTVMRDRQRRGKDSVKLVLFANAEEISTPVTNTLEIVDDMAELNASGQRYKYLEDRGIMLHHITKEECPVQEEEKIGIWQAMHDTAWGRKTWEGEFANNDFTNIKKISLKNMQCLIHLHYKSKDYYIYQRYDGMIYMCYSRHTAMFDYDLSLENDQKKFFLEQQIELRDACIEGRMKFEKYSMYDLIMNFKKFFKI